MIKKEKYMDDLVSYIKNNLKNGYTKESLKWALVQQGNSRLEVDKAMAKVDMELAHEAPILKTKPQIKYEVVETKEYSLKKPFWKRIFGR